MEIINSSGKFSSIVVSISLRGFFLYVWILDFNPRPTNGNMSFDMRYMAEVELFVKVDTYDL